MAGRPSKFTDQVKERMLELYEKGATDAQVARAIGVAPSTIGNWKGRDSELLATIKESKSIADDLVEASMFSRATGYKHPEEKIFVYEGQVIRVPTIKHYPPDVTAGIFWLANRQPDRWKRNSLIQTPPPIDSTKVEQVNLLKTFEQFCIDSGYPKPYPKQLEMREFCFDHSDPRMLLGSRGYGKTDYGPVLGVAYEIYCNWFRGEHLDKETASTNLIITKSKSRNTAIIQEIAGALEKNGVPLEKENSTIIKVEGLVGKDYSVETITIKSSFRGRHPKRILMDDPVTEEDTSEAMRVLVKKKYDEAYKLCKNIVILGQPAHAYDLYAELREGLKLMLVPHGTIPELDADLVAMEKAGVDRNSIEMSYHLRVPTDGVMAFGNIRRIDVYPVGDSVAWIDPSHKGKDTTALTIARAYGQGVAVVGFVWKRAWNHCLDDMIPLLKKYQVRRLAFETNGLGTQPVEMIGGLLRGSGIGVVGRESSLNKHAKIMAAGSFSHVIHLSAESSKPYTDQVIKYEYGSEPDDAPDSLASLLEWIGLIRGKI